MRRTGSQLRTAVALLAWATVLAVVGLALDREQRGVRAELATRQDLVEAMGRMLEAVRDAARLGAESREDFRFALEAKGFRCFDAHEEHAGELRFPVVAAGSENGCLVLRPRSDGPWRAEATFPIGGDELTMRALVHTTGKGD
ncbi:MAG: hypothetical protein R3F30_13510 [Planctomycetota bacterium]